MRQLIAGNWKMNATTAQAADLAEALRGARAPCDLLVCPPATQLVAVARTLAGSAVAVGGQDCHAEPCGAHTGDISASMLRDAGARWVILGHSERRAEHAEQDGLVRAKVLAGLAAGLTPVVCVGETDEQRGAGRQAEVVGRQLAGSLPDGFAGVVAYEPVWAIGSGKSATEEDVEAMHALHPGGAAAAVPAGRGGDPHPVWRVGEAVQRCRAAGAAGRGRRAGRRCQPGGGGLPGDRGGGTPGLGGGRHEVPRQDLTRVPPATRRR